MNHNTQIKPESRPRFWHAVVMKADCSQINDNVKMDVHIKRRVSGDVDKGELSYNERFLNVVLCLT